MANPTNTAPKNAPHGERGPHYLDPTALMRIASLQLRAKSVVEGFFNGLHRSPYFGFSVEFSEYRPYVMGDDPRHLDWKLFARSDRFYIKRFEDETNRRCYFLVDQSRSMEFTSLEYSKATYARTVAATLAYFLTLQRDSVGLLTFDSQIRDYLPARHRPGHFHRLMLTLEQPLGGDRTNIEKPLEHLAGLVKKRGLVVLLSDLLAPIDQLSRSLGYLRACGHEILVLRILDPAEQTLRLSGPVLLEDMESRKKVFVDPSTARDQYQKKFQSHRQTLSSICIALGVDLMEIGTNQPVELSLIQLLTRQRRPERNRTRASGRGHAGTGR